MKRFLIVTGVIAAALLAWIALAPKLGRNTGEEYFGKPDRPSVVLAPSNVRDATEPATRPVEHTQVDTVGAIAATEAPATVDDCRIERSGHWIFGFNTEAAAIKWATRDTHATGSESFGLSVEHTVYLDRGELCERLPCSHTHGLSKVRLSSGSHLGETIWIDDTWTHGR
jgi:hypothetical protein